LRDSNNGERVTARLVPGDESAKAIAVRLTLKIYRASTARSDGVEDFNRPLRYRPLVY
jgi:hypothetical protein